MIGQYTPLSECRSGGHLEDLGAILEVLGVVVSTIWKPSKNWLESFIQNDFFMENCRGMVNSVFEFWSTFNEGSVVWWSQSLMNTWAKVSQVALNMSLMRSQVACYDRYYAITLLLTRGLFIKPPFKAHMALSHLLNDPNRAVRKLSLLNGLRNGFS